MPLARLSLAELIDRVRGDLRGRLEIGGPLLRRAMVDVLGAVWAGTVHILYGYLDWLAKQLFGDTAEREQLLRMAAVYGITPTPATFAIGSVNVTGVVGAVVPVDTIIRLDAATAYRVTTGQVLVVDIVTGVGIATVPFKAVLAGAAANVPNGTALTFESPLTGVNAVATVATGSFVNGVDEEGTEALRARYLLRLREPPEGGADQDYKAWALAVGGATRVWVYPNEIGLGTVVVRFVVDNNVVSIFPDAGAVAAVQAAENAKRPITAAVTVLAPTNLAVAFTIHVVPDNAGTRAAIAAELADLCKRVASPGTAVLLSQIRTAIGEAAGVTDYTMTIPAADVVPATGQLATVGVITWV